MMNIIFQCFHHYPHNFIGSYKLEKDMSGLILKK